MPAEVGEPQLRARVRAFLPHDDAHPLRPRGQVEQAGELGDPRAVANAAVAVIRRRPCPGRDGHDGVLHLIGHREPDRVLHAPAQVPDGDSLTFSQAEPYG